MYAMQGLTSLEAIAIWAVFGIAIVGLLYALFLRSQIMREDKGTEKMQEVWNAIKSGADAYLRKQFNSIWPLILVLAVALFLSVYIVPPSQEALERFSGYSSDSGPSHYWHSACNCLCDGLWLFPLGRAAWNAYGN